MEVIRREKLKEVLSWCLGSAPLLNEELEKKFDEFLWEIQNENQENEIEYENELHNKVADYLASVYELLLLSDEEIILGRNGSSDTPLIDATDCDVHLHL